MTMRLTIALTCTLFFAADSKLVHVPGGLTVDEACIVEVENGVLYDVDKHVMPEGCEPSNSPRIQIYASDVHLQSADPLKSFEADWIVPELPKEQSGQVVYFWPGFKAREPEMGLPVLQPVLMYGEYGRQRQLQSWFVDGKDMFRYPVVKSHPVDVKPGDKITSFMNQSSDGMSWTVSGTNVRTGEDSTLNIAYKKAGNTDYDYAMLVNENVNVNTDCQRMPAAKASNNGVASVTFTSVRVNGKVPTWTTRTNCKGNPQCDCGNTAIVASNGDVTLGWNTGSSNTEINV